VAFGYFVMLLETIGALMLTAGLFTRLISPMVAVQMAMICLIHYPKWAWIDRGMEYPFLMGLVALHIAFRGGGRFSLDRWIGKEV
jgi:putative oxidoreductase